MSFPSRIHTQLSIVISKLSILFPPKITIVKIAYKLDFIKAFPTIAAPKKVFNSIPKCPQSNPAKSNKGLGIEAQSITVQNPYFYKD